MTERQPAKVVTEFDERVEKLEGYLQSMPGLKELDRMIREGYTLQDIANHYGIYRETLYNIARSHPVIYQAIADGEDAFLEAVETSLRERCFAQKYREVTTTIGANGEVQRIVRKVKEVPPDFQAMQFYLTNRKPKKWRQRQETDISSASDKPIVIVDTITARVNEEERLKLLEQPKEAEDVKEETAGTD